MTDKAVCILRLVVYTCEHKDSNPHIPLMLCSRSMQAVQDNANDIRTLNTWYNTRHGHTSFERPTLESAKGSTHDNWQRWPLGDGIVHTPG